MIRVGDEVLTATGRVGIVRRVYEIHGGVRATLYVVGDVARAVRVTALARTAEQVRASILMERIALRVRNEGQGGPWVTDGLRHALTLLDAAHERGDDITAATDRLAELYMTLPKG